MKINSQDGIGTVVGANVRLQGILKDTNDISVYGVVDGEVVSEKMVIVADSASVKGPISADVVTVAGNVKGSIEAKTKLEILASGKVSGSVSSQTLIIHAGANFNGKSAMLEDKDKETDKTPTLKDFFKPEKEEKNDKIEETKPDNEPEIELE